MGKSSARNIREVHFHRHGTEVSPVEVFDVFYPGLDDLIAENTRRYNLGQGRMSRRATFGDERYGALVRVARESVEEAGKGFAALVHFDGGEKINYSVAPRTNYDDSLLKRPNIVYLNPTERGDRLILREARQPNTSEILGKVVREIFGTKFMDYDFKEVKSGSKVLKTNRVMMIPESPLVLALEQICLEHPELRITPEAKVVGVCNETMWYLRDFLDSLKDLPFNTQRMVRYVGILHGLGLMDSVDDNHDHYCVCNGGNIVTIDPDFLTYTKGDAVINDIGLDRFKKSVSEGFGESQFRAVRGEIKERGRIMGEVRGLMGKATILDYMPGKLSEAFALKSGAAVDNLEVKAE